MLNMGIAKNTVSHTRPGTMSIQGIQRCEGCTSAAEEA